MIGSLFSRDFAEHIKLLTGMENGIYRASGKVMSTYRGFDCLPAEVTDRLSANETVLIRNALLNNESSYFMLKPLFLKDNSYWGALSLGVSQKEEKRYLRYSEHLLYLMIGIGVLLALVIYTLLARNINRSLVKILAGMDGLNIDTFDTRIELETRDEFGLIARSFNRLVHKLSVYNRRILSLQDDMIKSAKLATAGQMAAGLAHEIRNPLSSIKMMAQILRSRHLADGDGREEVSTILSETERLNNLIKDMLEFARPSPMRFARHDLNGIVEGVLIRLCNDGQPIPVKDLTLIFEPFFTTKREGTGLGLAIVKIIVERHFGTVRVRSDKKRTCFSILIPEELEQRIQVM